MTTNELIKLLKKSGCYMVGHGGRHDIWLSPITNQTFPVPRHGAKEISVGTVQSIMKNAGLK